MPLSPAVLHKDSSPRRAGVSFIPRPSMLSSQTQSLSTRKPLRSSPLAGPSFSYINEEREENATKPKPSQTASAPNIPSVTISPPPQTAKVSSNPPLTSKRSSFRATQDELPPILGILRPPTPDSPTTHITVPSRAASIQGRDSDKRSVHRSSVHFQPQGPNPVPRTLPTDSSWMTDNTYETTPRFSRLSLSAAGVVLPVSAKEHRRKSRALSSSSLAAQFQALESEEPSAPSLRDTKGLHSHSMPSLIRTDSAASSRTSKDSSIVPATPPSYSLASLESAILAEDATVDTENSSHSSPHVHIASLPDPPKQQIAGWKILSIKTKKSFRDFKSPTLSFLDTKPPVKRPPPGNGKQQSPAVSEPGLQRGGTVKRLLRAVSLRRGRN